MALKRTIRNFKYITVLICIGLILPISSLAADKGTFSTTPRDNNGKKWRIGYHEGGPYFEYQLTLKSVVQQLAELGWIEPIHPPNLKNPEDTSELWIWFAKNNKSKFIEFVPDAYWSANWEDNLRADMKKIVLSRFKEKKDIDLIIAMGTWSAQDLAITDHNVPTLALAVSDPISAKIVKSVEDSGLDHVHARCDPKRYERQIQLFHDIIGFKKLGVAYENSDTGRSYAAFSDIAKVGKERGFEIISCYTKDETSDKKEADLSVVRCMEELSPKVGGVYITLQSGVNTANLGNILAPLNKHKVPTFSQFGSEEVKFGVMLSIAQAGFKYIGRYHAETIAKIFNGAKPRQLDQVFEDPPKIAINLEATKIIDYDPPVDILGVADEIFQEIQISK